MPEVSKATLKTYFEDGKEPDENKFIDLVDTLWEQGGGVSDHGALDGLADDDHSQYLLADGTRIVTGDFTVGNGTGARRIIVDGAADQYRGLYLQTAGENRFAIVLDDIAESGSAAGSDLNIWRYDDDEVATLDFAIDRSTGDLYQFKDIRCGGGLYVGGTGNPPPQGVIQSVSDIRAGGGLVVGSTSPNPASGYGVMGGGLSIGNLTPPYAIRGTLYFEFGTPKYGFISATEPLFLSAGTLYDGANWRQLGNSTSATFYINNIAGLIFRTDQTVRSPGAVNTHANVLTVDLDGNMKLKGGIVVGYISGTMDNDNITFYQGTTRVGEVGSDNTAWLKLNHVTDKPVYCPRYMRVDGGVSATSSVSDPGDGNVAAQIFRLYDGGTEVGRLEAQDVSWLRINQNVTKNIYTPRFLGVVDGIMSGTSIQPGTGDVGYTGNLRSYKSSTFRNVWGYFPYTTRKTSTSWDGDARSTSGATKIDLSAVFGIPANVKAVDVRLIARDSATHPQTARYFSLGPSASDAAQIGVRPHGNNMYSETNGVCNCDSNGDVYFTLNASGSLTMDCWIQINGYYI